jgi:hypothetical protein
MRDPIDFAELGKNVELKRTQAIQKKELDEMQRSKAEAEKRIQTYVTKQKARGVIKEIKKFCSKNVALFNSHLTLPELRMNVLEKGPDAFLILKGNGILPKVTVEIGGNDQVNVLHWVDIEPTSCVIDIYRINPLGNILDGNDAMPIAPEEIAVRICKWLATAEAIRRYHTKK